MLVTSDLVQLAGMWFCCWAFGYGAGALLKAFRQLADKMTG